MEKKSLDQLFETATQGPVTDVMKFLLRNKIINFTNFGTKFGLPIPYDFRIDQACYGSAVVDIGERQADQMIAMEKELNLQFDSIFCSLYSGVFGGIGIAACLKQKYNRNINIAISRRSYNQGDEVRHYLMARHTSIHPLKPKTWCGNLTGNILIIDEMANTGNTLKELITICRDHRFNVCAAMIIADRILDPLPPESHTRIIVQIPCCSLITHYEIVDWCNANQTIYQELYQPTEY
jgi:hypothetical protein